MARGADGARGGGSDGGGEARRGELRAKARERDGSERNAAPRIRRRRRLILWAPGSSRREGPAACPDHALQLIPNAWRSRVIGPIGSYIGHHH